MPSTYCSSCGHKTDYSLQKPKFCSECGQSLATLKPSVAKKKESEPVNSEENIENFDPDGSDVYEVPEIRGGLQYEIEVTEDPSFTLGSIMPEPSSVKKINKKRSRTAKGKKDKP
jgi:ribosomal protein L37E